MMNSHRFRPSPWPFAFRSSAIPINSFWRTCVTSLVVLSAFFAFLNVAHADETSEAISGIMIEEAVLEPAKKGENSRLRFKISNESSQNLSLLGVRSSIARAGVVKMNLNEEGFKPVEGLTILREETLNLRSSHIRIELVDLLEDIKPNSKIEFDLVFSNFETSAIADVH